MPSTIAECSLNFAEIVRYRSEFLGCKKLFVESDILGRDGPIHPLLARAIGTDARVLDVGAWDRALGKLPKITAKCYRSVDVDGAYQHDFSHIDEVSGEYDFAIAAEMIEQMALDEAHHLLHRIFQLLAPGGRLWVSTPNPMSTARYFGNVMNKQFWPAGDLYAVLRHTGFDRVDMYGVVYRNRRLSLSRRMLNRFREYAQRAIGIETCTGLVAIALKN